MIEDYNLARSWTEDGYLGQSALDDLAIDCDIAAVPSPSSQTTI